LVAATIGSIKRIWRGQLVQAEPHRALNRSPQLKSPQRACCFKLLGILGDNQCADFWCGCRLRAQAPVFDKSALGSAGFRAFAYPGILTGGGFNMNSGSFLLSAPNKKRNFGIEL